MKKATRISPLLFFLLGTLCGALALAAVFLSLQKPACLWKVPQNAISCTQKLMESICQGDYNGVSTQIQGNPDLGLDEQSSDAITVLLWEAYQASCAYQFDGDMYSTKTGLAQDVQFEALDLNEVLARAQVLWPELLASRLKSMSNTNSVYDEEGNFKDEFIHQVLLAAIQQVLAQDPPMVQTGLTLQLTYQNNQWRVKSDGLLLKIICGGIAA